MLAPAADQVPPEHVWQSLNAVLPRTLFAVPALQGVQVADPAVDHDPSAHVRQSDASV